MSSSANRSLASTRDSSAGVPALEIALVNNMPDAAFAETERQFVALLGEAAGALSVRLSLYSLPGLRRSEDTARYIAARYETLQALFARGADAAIITGTEPIASQLADEPYWGALAGLIGWAEESTTSTVLSCLAAHAAVLLFDGAERRPLEAKCSGVFAHDVVADHALVAGMAGPIFVPHSRLNEVPDEALPDTYVSLLGSSELSWTVLARERGRCLFVFVQGHPEYSTSSLLREYKRDLQRYLRGERSTQPPIPLHYLDEHSERILNEFAAEASRRPAAEDVMAGFPFDEVRQRVVNTWRPQGERLYANWISEVLRRKHFVRTGQEDAAPLSPARDERGTRVIGA